MSKIPIKIEQFDDEPAWSVLRRLARLAGTSSAHDFCLDFDLDLAEIETATELSTFAARGGYDLSLLQRKSIITLNIHHKFAGEEIPKGAVIGGENRVCLACLQNDLDTASGNRSYAPHWRDWWFLKGITACPFHGNKLVSIAAPRDKGRIATDILDPLQGLVPHALISKVNDTASEAYFLGRLGFMPSTPHWLLDSLSVGNGLKAVQRFGAAVRFGIQSLASETGDTSDTNSLMSAGFEVLSSSSRLNQYLDDVYSSSDAGLIKKGPRKVYGILYMWLKVEQKLKNTGPAYDGIRNFIKEHSVRRFTKQPVEELFSERLITKRPIVWALEEQVGNVSGPSARAAHSADGVDPVESSNLVNAPDDSLAGEAIIAAVKELSRQDLIDVYGIPRGTFIVLRDAGQLLPKHRRVRTKNNRKIWHTQDVDRWFKRLSGKAKRYPAVPSGMSSLVGASSVTQVSIDKIVSALLGGHLQASGLLDAEKPWPAILIDVKDVRLKFYGRETSPFLSRREAILELKSTPAIVEALIDQGHLVTHVLNGAVGIPKVCVDTSELHVFNREFISSRAAAWHVGTAVKTLRRQLGARGVLPAIDLKISPNAIFYRRGQIEAIPANSLRLYEPRGQLSAIGAASCST